MKQVLTAAFLAIAFTGTASAYDYPTGNTGNGYGDSYSAEKTDAPVKKHEKSIKVSEDPNPSKLKKQLEFFDQFTIRD